MRLALLAFFAILALCPPVNAQDRAISDQEIVLAILAQSKIGYAGSCPCPENTDRAGRRCGKRSAYSRPGGEAPLCYTSDVTAEMIAAFRKSSKSSAR
jgi:hypothetical protein